MKKSKSWCLFVLFGVFMCVDVVFGADSGSNGFSWTELLKSMFVNGGWIILLYIVFRVGLWIVRKTETTTDDKIVDNYVSKAVQFALQIIPSPETTEVNWVKFVGNALAKFNEAYTKEQGDAPDLSTIAKAKKLITEIADTTEFKNAKDVLDHYKANKEIA